MPDVTPDSLLIALQQIRAEMGKALGAVRDAEEKAETAELALDAAKARSLLRATGTVDERKAKSVIESEPEATAAIIAKAEFNRIKLKLRLLEVEQMNIQSQAKLALGAGA